MMMLILQDDSALITRMTPARTLMGMPVQWKPWGKSTRLPSSLWNAAANTSCNVDTGAVVCQLLCQCALQGWEICGRILRLWPHAHGAPGRRRRQDIQLLT